MTFCSKALFISIPRATSQTISDNGRVVAANGFIIGVPSKVDDHFMYLYAVTNRHVIEGKHGVAKPSPIIRVNMKAGGFKSIHKTVDDWKLHPDDEDLAMCYIETDIDQSKHDVDFAIPVSWFRGKNIDYKYGDRL